MTWTGGLQQQAAPAWRQPFSALLDALEDEQDRWFLWLPVLFGLGIALYFALPFEPALGATFAPAVLALLLLIVWREGVFALLATAMLLALSFGFFTTKLRASRVAAPVIERPLQNAEVTGWIELVEPRPAKGQRLTIRVVSIAGLSPDAKPERVRVRTAKADAALQPGDAVKLRATLSPPPGPALPGGFDFARSAWFQGLGAVGYTREAPTRVAIEAAKPWDLVWRSAIERVRQAIGRRITAALPGETGAIATALITGERGGISDATNNAYRDSGLLHILSISGLHMVIMAGAVFLSVRFLLTLVSYLALNYPIKKWAATAAALGALGYLLISGASFPTVRSYIMISIMLLAVLLDRSAMALRNIALAAFAILVVYPESLIDVGFQMSFAAVTALVAAYEWMRNREDRRAIERQAPGMFRSAGLFLGGILLSTLIASLAVAPFAAFHFHKSQQFAMIANLIAIPICNVLVMPAALAVLVAMPFGLEAWPVQLMGLGIDAMTWVAYKVAGLPGAVGRIPEIPILAFGLMVAGGLWLCLWQRRWRFAGLIPIVAGLAVAPMRQVSDLYIGRDGLVAVRTKDGTLSALSPRGASFDLARILEHDGDGRRPEDVANGRAFRCDSTGCTADVRGQLIAVARHVSALGDDCGRAAVVIVPGSAIPERVRRDACRAVVVIDKAALRKGGAHAVKLATPKASEAAGENATEFSTVTVAATRGERPWARESDSGFVAAPASVAAGRQRSAPTAPRPERSAPLDDDP